MKNNNEMTRLEQYEAFYKAMMANRDERFGRTPKLKELEELLTKSMEWLFAEMNEEEREKASRPEPPRYQNSVIAQDSYGRLIGFEDLDD